MSTQASPRIQSRYASRRSSWIADVIGFDSTRRSLACGVEIAFSVLKSSRVIQTPPSRLFEAQDKTGVPPLSTVAPTSPFFGAPRSTSWLPLAVRYNSALAATRHVGPLAMLGIWATLCFGGGLYASWLGY